MLLFASVSVGHRSFAKDLKNTPASCQSSPTYLQLYYKFSWTSELQSSYANKFQSDCISASYIGNLTDEIRQRLARDSISVQQLVVLPQKNSEIISIKIITDNDGAANAPELSVLLPLVTRETASVITSLEVIGQPQEGEELIARYTVNETNYQTGNGQLTLQWMRDGQQIAGATKSRYRLQKEDVGAQIDALLTYGGNQATFTDSRKALVKAQIVAANYPPSIEDLRIEGLAETGQNLSAKYRFVDENEGDREGETTFTWLRDNIAIPDANGPTYALSASDIDKQISVRVEPRSQDGQTGKARSATLAQKVKSKAVIATQDVVDNIIKNDKQKTFDAAELEAKIAKPTKRPDVPKIDVPAPVPQDEVALEKDAPAIIIAPPAEDKKDKAEEPVIIADDAKKEEDDAPILLSEPSPPPVILTPGFEILASSPKIFKGLEFTPTAILLEYELKRSQAAVTGTPITLEAIKSVLDELNALYLDKGFELSRALLPEQTVTDGIVKIQLVEATIGKIVLENRKNIKEDFILAHLGIDEGDYISLQTLERAIRTYNLSNKSKLATELGPGEEFGQTDIFVDVSEPDRVELPSVSINNYANKTSDWQQNALSITLNNMYGIDDETALSYSDSNGSNTFSGSVSVPTDHIGSNLSLAGSMSDTKIVAGSEETVGYRGSSSSLAATYSTPMLFGDEYSVYLSGSYGVSKSDLVQPVTGAMLSKSEVRKFSLASPYSYNNGTTAFSVSPSWHVLNVVTKIPEKDKWMQKLDVDLSASHFLSDKWTLNGRGKMLYTNARDMINMPSEILSVGGPSSVRAYQPSESSGYQGYFISGELRTDLANWEQISLPSFMPSAQPYIFIDHMMAQTQYKVRSRGDYWSGYGVGLQIPSIFNLLTFDVYWSEPLDGDIHAKEKEFYEDELFQFSLSARFRIQ